MPLFEAGTTFLDHRAINIQGEKPKYFIGMNNADFDDDVIIAFVFDTEHKEELKKSPGCHKGKQKFVLKPHELSYLTSFTTVELATPRYYQLKNICESNTVKILECADENLARRIKNCIDMNYIVKKFHQLIKDSFK